MDTDKKDPSVPVEQVNAPGIEDMPQSAPASSEIADEEQPAQDPAPSTEAGNEKRPDAAAAEQQPEAAEPGDTQTDADTSAERVDFSDEDAALAASAPEFDLGEASEEESADLKKESGDYTGKTKEELLSAFETLLSTQPVQIIRNDAEAIKVAFYKIYRSETEQLRRQFVESGGLIEQFVPPTDAAEQRLKELFAEYRRKRNEYMARLDEEKEANYRTKLQIIEELKELIDSNETLNHTFNSFRELQRRWKETGPVPQTHLKDLWETYNMYVENFYNFIKINKELRDLDLKKNYEAKLQLCEEADALVLETSVITAFHKLQKLHEQWREIGPVANEYKEPLWDRFREASSKINKRHQEYFDNIKEEQKRNLELKTQLCVRTEELSEASPTTRKEWNKASEQLIEIQKVWKTIGFAPKKSNVKIFERFRAACDVYFNRKSEFYKNIKDEMEKNLALKKALCEKAEALKDSTDWKSTTEKMIALQKEWKTIGSVARKHSDAVWKRFITACDYFFEQKNKNVSSQKSVEQTNLAAKKALIEKINTIDEADHDEALATLKGYMAEWNAIGHVPFKEKDKIYKEYHEAVDKQFDRLKVDQNDRKMQTFRNSLSDMSNGERGKGKLYGEREKLMRMYERMKNELQTYENNIGFLSISSKGGGGLLKEMERKIDKLKDEMALIIKKIDAIDENLE